MSIFSKIQVERPRRSLFNLSHSRSFDCEMGQCIPILIEEVMPGDKFKLGNEFIVRFQPTVAPIPDNIDVKVDYFEVPHRLVFNRDLDGQTTVTEGEETRYIDNSFENFITLGVNGEDTISMPKWEVSSGKNGACSLWDYCGFPTGVTPTGLSAPTDMVKRSINLIWNEFYRDENLQDKINIKTNEDVLYANWSKDYFTSAFLERQRGVSPSFPINSKFNIQSIAELGATGYTYKIFPIGLVNGSSDSKANYLVGQDSNGKVYVNKRHSSGSFTQDELNEMFNEGFPITSTSFNMNDFRLAYKIQLWQERNLFGGVRYVEFLRAHFGTAPRDEVLQRPRYLGGTRTPVIATEVLQQSETGTTPQGNFTGHLLTADANHVSVVDVKEFGYIIGIMRIMPKARYTQGIDKQFLRNSPYEYPFPEFVGLSEDAIKNEEIFTQDGDGTGDTDNRGVWGYQGHLDEFRVRHSKVLGNLRGNLDYWTLARKFNSLPALNGDFIKCQPSKRIFAVTTQSTPACVVDFFNKVKALRPIPYYATPSL